MKRTSSRAVSIQRTFSGAATLTVAGFAVSGFAAGCGTQGSAGSDSLTPPPPAQAPPAEVQTTQPERRDVSRLISLPGEIKPWQEAVLYAKVAGYVDKMNVDKGDPVRAGQVLAVLRAPEIQADTAQARGTYAAQRASAEGSSAEAEEAGQSVAQARLAAEKAAADSAQGPANVARAQAQVKQAQEALHQAEAQKAQAEAQRDEARAQVAKAQADLQSAQSEQKLAEQTAARYRGIYDQEHALIAKQDVDTYESRAETARSRAAAAQSGVDTAQQHAQSAAAQVAVVTAQIEQAKAQIAAAQEQVGIAHSQQTSLAKQAEIARRQVGISERQQAAAKAKASASQGQAAAAGAALGRAGEIAGYTEIRAPFDGVVTQRSADPGAFIQTAAASQNAASLVTIAQVDRVRLYVNVPETEASFVHPGTSVQFTLTPPTGSTPPSPAPGTTPPPAPPPLRGQVTRTSESLDPKTRTLLAEVDLPNPKHAFLPGAYASVKVVQQTHKGVLSVPTPAINKDKAGKSVFVVEGGKAKRVPVKTGFDDGKSTEITDGLSGSEQVIVKGKDTLTPGAAVTITNGYTKTGQPPSK